MSIIITTKYIPATDFKGSKFKATMGRLSMTLSYDYDLTAFQNHVKVAKSLLQREGINMQDLTEVGCIERGYKFAIGALRYLVRYPNGKPDKGIYGHRRMIVTANNPTEALQFMHEELKRIRGYSEWDLNRFQLDKENSTPTCWRFTNEKDSRACAYIDISEDN